MPAHQCIQTVLADAYNTLSLAGLNDSPRLDAQLLLCAVLNQPRSYLYTWPEKSLTATQLKQFTQLLSQRKRGLPIAYLTGTQEFWGLPLKVTQDTLIPRADTETLVEKCLEILTDSLTSQAPPSILDIGTGSGAIALALKTEQTNALVTATDASLAALDVARQNATSLGLNIEFLHSDWFTALTHRQFDIIVSNPPYIEVHDPHLTQADVRFEPINALASGNDGLEALRHIIEQAQKHLNSPGWLLLEHGYQQASAVQQLLKAAGFQTPQTQQDLAGLDRITWAQYIA